jgi:ADP-ribose pyrophosphatase
VRHEALDRPVLADVPERVRPLAAVGRCRRAHAGQYGRVTRPDSARTVYDGKLFDVAVERWGEHEREVVQHPGAVAIVAVDADERVVLVRQLREPARRQLLELPAGTLDDEEPEACARRELEEETGLTGGSWERGPSFWTTPGFCTELMHVFFAEGVIEGEQRQEADEEIELVRIPVAALAARLDELEDAKTIAALLLFLRRRGL